MLTVRVMSTDGTEQILCGSAIGFNPKAQCIAISGIDSKVFLKPGDIAYVMNENGKTVSNYTHLNRQ